MTSQIGYLKLLITRSILSGPLDFEIKRVACTSSKQLNFNMIRVQDDQKLSLNEFCFCLHVCFSLCRKKDIYDPVVRQLLFATTWPKALQWIASWVLQLVSKVSLQ